MTLFGEEHDVMMEIAYPFIISAVVPIEKALEMSLCDTSIQTFKSEWQEGLMKFSPYFRLTREEGKKLDCPIIHHQIWTRRIYFAVRGVNGTMIVRKKSFGR